MKNFSNISIRFLLLAVISFLFSSAALTEDNSSSTIKSAKIKSYVASAVKYFQLNEEARQWHLPDDFLLARIGEPVVTEYLRKDLSSQRIYLNPKIAVFADMGRMLNWKTDKANTISVYSKLFNALPKKYRKSLIPPSKLKSLSLREINNSFSNLAKHLSKNFDRVIVDLDPDVQLQLTINPIASCSSEEGDIYAGAGGELSGSCDLNEYRTDGLFLNNRFPLRDKLTCIRDQGRRGTCTAMAVTAAVETLNLVAGGVPQNLSEEDIYYHFEVFGDSEINVVQMQLYGNAVDNSLDVFVRRNFGVFYERDWAYNRSLEILVPRIDSATGLIVHPNSCASNYFGPDCGDSVWHTDSTPQSFGFPQAENPPTADELLVHRIRSNSFLPGIGSGQVGADFSLQTAIALLAVEQPVIISMDITDQFSTSGGPYIRQISPDPVRGGHTMLAVGFVRNSRLPSGVTPATEEGYFIVKNSWGTDSGDCGFYYLDYAYVKRHFYYINSITI